MTTSKETSFRPNPNPLMDYLAKTGAFGEYKLNGGRSRVGLALGRYITPFLNAGDLQALAIGYDESSTREYPFGNIRLLVVLVSKEAREIAKELSKKLIEDYPDLPLKFYPTVRDKDGNINPNMFQSFAKGIEPKIFEAQDLKPAISK